MIRAFLVLDDGVWILYRNGTLERLLPGGHPRAGAASVPEHAGRPRRYP